MGLGALWCAVHSLRGFESLPFRHVENDSVEQPRNELLGSSEFLNYMQSIGFDAQSRTIAHCISSAATFPTHFGARIREPRRPLQCAAFL
jgi:hypothetical protein